MQRFCDGPFDTIKPIGGCPKKKELLKGLTEEQIAKAIGPGRGTDEHKKPPTWDGLVGLLLRRRGESGLS